MMRLRASGVMALAALALLSSMAPRAFAGRDLAAAPKWDSTFDCDEAGNAPGCSLGDSKDAAKGAWVDPACPGPNWFWEGANASMALEAGCFGLSMESVASFANLTEAELRQELLNVPPVDLAVTFGGGLFNTDTKGGAAGAKKARSGAASPMANGEDPIDADPSENVVFNLHSRISAEKKIWLRFTGCQVPAGGRWLSNNDLTQPGNGPAINQAAFSLDADASTFNAEERAFIASVWRRVAADFAPFDVDVTTQEQPLEAMFRDAAADTAYGMIACIGPLPVPDVIPNRPNVVGVALRGDGGIFDDIRPNTANWEHQPAWIFPGRQENSVKRTAETVSHEVGHTLGLRHDGRFTNDPPPNNIQVYYPGTGNWAPIMGNSDAPRRVGTWDNSSYANARLEPGQADVNDIATLSRPGFLPLLPVDDINAVVELYCPTDAPAGTRPPTPYACEAIGPAVRRIVVPRALIPQPAAGGVSDSDVFTLRAGTGRVTVTVHVHGEDGTVTAASNVPLVLTAQRAGPLIVSTTLNTPNDGSVELPANLPDTTVIITVAADPTPINGQPNTIGNGGWYSLEVTFFAEGQACPAITTATPCVSPTPAPTFASACDPTTSFCVPFNGGFCTSNYRGTGFVCRAANGACDAAESCTGDKPHCPEDRVRPSSFVCAARVAACELDATCDGVGKTCPPKLARPAEPKFVCAKPDPATQPCGADSTCDGVALTCPAIKPRPAEPKFVCAKPDPATQPCGADSTCDGTVLTCPAIKPRPAEPKFVCAKPDPATQRCAADATCNGSALLCPDFPPKAKLHPPAEANFHNRIVCDAAIDPCEEEAICSPTSNVCPAKPRNEDGLLCHPDTDELFDTRKPSFLGLKEKAKVKKCFGMCMAGRCRDFVLEADNKSCKDIERIG